MDEKIRERMNGAYKNIKLGDDLKSQAEANLLKKVQQAGKWRVSREMLVMAAVVIVFVAVNAVMIGLNLKKGNEVTPVESTDAFQKYLLAEFFVDVEAESFLVEYEGEAFREKDFMSRLNAILHQIVVTDVEGQPGTSILKISAQTGKGTETLRWVEICDNGTVIIDGKCYQADVTREAVSDIEVYRRSVFDMYLEDGSITKLEQILTIDDVWELANCPNAFVKFFDEEEKNFCVAVLCYDANGVRCTTDENIATYVGYAYFEFDEQGTKVAESLKTFDAKSQEWEMRGVVEFLGEWYEVADGKEGGSAHYYEMTNIMAPEKMMYPSRFDDFDLENYISSNTQFFMDLVDDYIVVRDIINENSGKVFDFSQVNTKVDLEELMAGSNVYSKVLSQNQYLVVLPYNAHGVASSYSGQMTEIRIGYFTVLENGDLEFLVIPLSGEGNAMESLGITCYENRWHLFGKLKDYEQYKVIELDTGDEEIMYCDEEVCREILSGGSVEYFAKGEADYWLLGTEVVAKEKKDSKTYCSNHDWDEMCTSTMSVRDVYVAPNWIGGSAKEYIGLEIFFDDFVMTDFEDGEIFVTEDSSENAYQINIRFEELNFQVSTEPDSDEIIAVTLYGNHNYVTEDVWLGMNMEEVKKRMNIDDSAFFEEGVVKFASFERDGYLYELSFVVNGNGDYLLGFSCVSDAAKIKSSSVKSFGERLKEGGVNAIYAQ